MSVCAHTWITFLKRTTGLSYAYWYGALADKTVKRKRHSAHGPTSTRPDKTTMYIVHIYDIIYIVPARIMYLRYTPYKSHIILYYYLYHFIFFKHTQAQGTVSTRFRRTDCVPQSDYLVAAAAPCQSNGAPRTAPDVYYVRLEAWKYYYRCTRRPLSCIAGDRRDITHRCFWN